MMMMMHCSTWCDHKYYYDHDHYISLPLSFFVAVTNVILAMSLRTISNIIVMSSIFKQSYAKNGTTLLSSLLLVPGITTSMILLSLQAFLRQIFQTHLDTYGSVEGTEAPLRDRFWPFFAAPGPDVWWIWNEMHPPSLNHPPHFMGVQDPWNPLNPLSPLSSKICRQPT